VHKACARESQIITKEYEIDIQTIKEAIEVLEVNPQSRVQSNSKLAKDLRNWL
jgi:hypothetical protein